ncbi:sensor histidine kinase [Robinsoniella peoriensis]|uniref:sensor histidine kinase n=1 Tax=Robinsoniella peoriensis TaxID=180332 RepID=UPI0036719EC9
MKGIKKAKKELRRCLFDILFGVSMVFILISFSAYSVYTWHENTSESDQYYREAVKNICMQIDDAVQDMDTVACQIVANQELQKMLMAAGTDEYRDRNYFEYNSAERWKAQEILWVFNMPHKLVEGIHVFTGSSYVGLSMSPSPKIVKQNSAQPKWAVEKDQYRVLPPHRDDWTQSGDSCFSLVRRMLHTNSPFEDLGFVEVQKSDSVLEDICSAKDGNSDYEITILNKRNQVIFSLGEPDSWKSLQFSSMPGEIESIEYKDSSGVKMVAVYGMAECVTWTVMLTQPKAEYMRPVYTIVTIVTVVGILLLALLAVAFSITARQIAEPINRLAGQVRKVSLDTPLQTGEFNEKYCEVEMLRDTFEEMTAKLKGSAEQLAMVSESELCLRIDQLQAKINPHFLYNALMSIGAAGEESGNEKVEQMCFELSALFRYISADHPQMVTLQEEMEHVSLYLHFMKYRYEDSFQYNSKLESQVASVPVCRLIFQPIIENCFSHGFKSIAPPFQLSAVCSRTEYGWRFCVEDNGRGFDSESQKKIWQKIKRIDKIFENKYGYEKLQPDNMAIISVYVRLKYQYRSRVQILIDNDSSLGGARVVIEVEEREEKL